MTETTIDFKIGDDYAAQKEANHQEALRDFYGQISDIQITFEHLIIDSSAYNTEIVELEDVLIVAKGLNDMDKLKDFSFTDFYDDEVYEYDFSKEVERIKYDELGLTKGGE